MIYIIIQPCSSQWISIYTNGVVYRNPRAYTNFSTTIPEKLSEFLEFLFLHQYFSDSILSTACIFVGWYMYLRLADWPR